MMAQKAPLEPQFVLRCSDLLQVGYDACASSHKTIAKRSWTAYIISSLFRTPPDHSFRFCVHYNSSSDFLNFFIDCIRRRRPASDLGRCNSLRVVTHSFNLHIVFHHNKQLHRTTDTVNAFVLHQDTAIAAMDLKNCHNFL